MIDLTPAAPVLNSPPTRAKNGTYLNVSCPESVLVIKVASARLSTNPTTANCSGTSPINIALNWATEGTTTLSVTAVDAFPNTSAATTHDLTVDLTAPTVTITRAGGQSATITPSTSARVINFTATFSETMQGLSGANITHLGTATGVTWNVTTSNDIAYNLEATVPANQSAVTVQPSLLANVAQDLTSINNTASVHSAAVVTITAAGVLDTTFGSYIVRYNGTANAADYGAAITRDSSGNIIIAGRVYNGTNADLGLWKYKANGTPDTSFSGDGFLQLDVSGDEFPYAVGVDASGNIYAAGHYAATVDMILWKFNSAGTLQWTRTRGGDAGSNCCNDVARTMAIDSSGNIFLAGYGSNGTSEEMIVWKYLPTGTLDTTFGSPNGFIVNGNVNGGNGSDAAQAIALDGSGNIYLSGWSATGANNDMAVWKLSSTGTVLWRRSRNSDAGGNGNDAGTGIAVIGTSIYVGGYSSNTTPAAVPIVWKYDTSGNLDTSWNGDGIAFSNSTTTGGIGGMAIDSSNNIYFSGYSQPSNADLTVWKFNALGNLDTTFSGDGVAIFEGLSLGGSTVDPGHDSGGAITIDALGYPYITGYSGSFANDDMILIKVTPTGTLAPSGSNFSNSSCGGTGSEIGIGMTRDSSGNIYIAGNCVGPTGSTDLAVWKYKADGTLDPTFDGDGIRTHNGAAGGNGVDGGRSIAIDSSGNIFVAGHSDNATPNYDLAIWKFLPSGALDTTFDGDGIRVHNGAAGGNSHEIGLSMVLDASNKIYITGYSANASGNTDLVVWKFLATGALDTSFDGDGIRIHHNAAGGNADDQGQDIALDASGNVYVGGFSMSASNSWDLAVWKFLPSGAFDTTFDGDGFRTHNAANGVNDNDHARALALDASGNIYLTGTSLNTSGNFDVVVWKFLPTGALDTSFDGDGFRVHNGAAGGNGFDIGATIALDAGGSIYVSGASANANGVGNMAIWRFLPTGALDTTFDGDGFLSMTSANGYGYKIIVGSDGVYVCGQIEPDSGRSDLAIWKFK